MLPPQKGLAPAAEIIKNRPQNGGSKLPPYINKSSKTENNMDKRKRKHPRLKTFDYSSNKYYFVTICTLNRQPIMSDIVYDENNNAEPLLTQTGKICEELLLQMERRFHGVTIEKYVIMPDHIHAVIAFSDNVVSEIPQTAGASPRPTLMDVICTFKSLTTRRCNTMCGIQGRKIFQTSFYEHIVRNEKEYYEICKYIDDNPINWIFPT